VQGKSWDDTGFDGVRPKKQMGSLPVEGAEDCEIQRTRFWAEPRIIRVGGNVFLYLSTILGGTKLILCNHTSSVRTVWFTTAIVGQFHPLAAFIACGLARPRLAWLSGIPGSSIYGKELSLVVS
jgi:hypothetical protein